MMIYIEVIMFYGMVLALFLAFLGPWTRYRIDLLRHKLFKVRDDLFWYVANADGIDHTSDAYCMARTTINGMIRFADELTLGQLFIDYWVFRKSPVLGENYEQDFEAALLSLDEGHRLKLDYALTKMHEAVIAHVIATSPILCGVFLPTKVLAIIFPNKNTSVVRSLLERARFYISLLDAAANTLGSRITESNVSGVGRNSI